jgi:hypothetical protein
VVEPQRGGADPPCTPLQAWHRTALFAASTSWRAALDAAYVEYLTASDASRASIILQDRYKAARSAHTAAVEAAWAEYRHRVLDGPPDA